MGVKESDRVRRIKSFASKLSFSLHCATRGSLWPFYLIQQAVGFTSQVLLSRQDAESVLFSPYHGSNLFGWSLPLGQTKPQMAPLFQHMAAKSVL